MIAALVTSAATIVAASIAAFIVMWQISQGERLKLKLRLYEDFSTRVHSASNATTNLNTQILSVRVRAREWQHAPPDTHTHPPRERSRALLDLYGAVGEAVVDVVIAIERYEVIDTRLAVFRLAFASSLHDLSEAWSEFADRSRPLLPLDEVSRDNRMAAGNWRRPSAAESVALEAASEATYECLSDLLAFLGDLQRELQNLLLADLFKNRIPPRKPEDPSKVVVTIEQSELLKRHFETETAWGRRMQEILAAVRAHLADGTAADG